VRTRQPTVVLVQPRHTSLGGDTKGLHRALTMEYSFHPPFSKYWVQATKLVSGMLSLSAKTRLSSRYTRASQTRGLPITTGYHSHRFTSCIRTTGGSTIPSFPFPLLFSASNYKQDAANDRRRIFQIHSIQNLYSSLIEFLSCIHFVDTKYNVAAVYSSTFAISASVGQE